MKWKKGLVIVAAITMLMTGCSNTSGSEVQSSESQTEKNNEVVIYFARHGKTMLNTVDRSQGWIDAPLTPAGVEVAEALGKGLSDVEFNKAYSSDSGRAIETAELILANNGQDDLEVTKDKRLREYNFGTYEGMLNEEMMAAVAEKKGLSVEEYMKFMQENGFYKSIKEFADILSELDKANVEEGVNWPAEDSKTIETRLQESLNDIVEEAKEDGGGNILVVSHGMSIVTLLGDLDENIEVPASGLSNASISKVTYKEGKYTVDSVNDLSYVEKGQKQKN
ncbi:histidine phosphatase family protein [Paenibacillus xylanilyticus]|uniref:Histidine phosphatase family protein n=1 Tax=Paenibacillus xylanilyticus TaxID=248903 RepID=A0A7Y6C2Y6_9BACL|nr:histidine phosphatase family protein [Paenibacillus xylanilyticus]NUU79551.1 histidine phosphatase family protein [Paenibacillus xylanilyticus]